MLEKARLAQRTPDDTRKTNLPVTVLYNRSPCLSFSPLVLPYVYIKISNGRFAPPLPPFHIYPMSILYPACLLCYPISFPIHQRICTHSPLSCTYHSHHRSDTPFPSCCMSLHFSTIHASQVLSSGRLLSEPTVFPPRLCPVSLLKYNPEALAYAL